MSLSMTVIEFLQRGCTVTIDSINDHDSPRGQRPYRVELLGNGTPTVYADGPYLSRALSAFNAEVEARKSEIDMYLIPQD